MANNVDKRVVQMQFDNAQFEKGIKTSTASLNQFEKSLDLSGAAKGLDGINSAARKVDVSPIGSAVETVKMKFSALEVIAVTALANITNQAIETGKQLIKSLGTDNIATGWDKYNRKVAATQTIMAATGLGIDEVNGQLEKLMWFTDETSYDFVAMVENIGKFTSAGISLDDAVTSMMGIANWAAVSGVATSETARAMTNLSQAMGSGALMLKDWYTVESMNMATIEFKNAVIEAALAVGTLKKTEDGFISTTANGQGKLTEFTSAAEGFRESLSSGWINVEVMNRVFKRYGSFSEAVYQEVESSGKLTSQVIEELSGNYDELAEKSFKAGQVAKTFADAMEAVRDAVSSQWMASFELIFGNLEEASSRWTRLSNELWDVFAGPLEARNVVLQEWYDKGGQEALWNGLFNILTAIENVIFTIRDAWSAVFPKMSGKTLADITRAFEKFTEKLVMSEPTMEKVSRILQGLFSILSIAKTIITPILKMFGTIVTSLIPKGNGGFLEFIATLADGITKFSEWLKEIDIFGRAFGWLGQQIAAGITYIKEFIGAGVEWVKSLDLFRNLSEEIGKIFADITAKIKAFDGFNFSNIEDWTEKFKAFWADFGNKMSDVYGKAQISFDNFSKMMHERFPGLFAYIDRMKQAFAEMGNNFMNFLKNLTVNDIVNIVNTGLFAGLVMAIRNFSKWVTTLGEEIGGVVKSVAGILDGVRDSLKAFASDIKAAALLKIAKAVALLAVSLIVLTFINPDDLKNGLEAITVLLLELSISMALMGKANLNALGIGLVGLGTGMILLSVAVKKLGVIDKKILDQGLGALLELLVGIAAMSRLFLSVKNHVISFGIGLAFLALGLTALALPVKVFANLLSKVQDVGTVMAILVGTILAFGLITRLLPSEGKFISFAVSLGIMAFSLSALVIPIRLLGNMDWTVLALGLGAIAIAMFAFAGASALAKPKNMIKLGAALVIMAEAFAIVAIALAALIIALKDTDVDIFAKLGAVLLPLVGVMALLIAISSKMGKNTSGLTKFAKAIVLFGIGVLATVGALYLLSKLLTKETIDTVLEFAQTIAECAKPIAKMIATLIEAVVEAVILSLGPVLDGVGVALLMIADACLEYVPQITAKIAKLIVDVLDALIPYLPEILSKIETVLEIIIGAIVDLIGKIEPKAAVAVLLAVGVMGLIFTKLKSLDKGARKARSVATTMAIIYGEIGLVFAAISNIATDRMFDTSVGLSIGLLAMAETLNIMTKMKVSIASAAEAAAALGVFATILAGVLVIIGGLAYIGDEATGGGVTTSLDTAVEIMTKLGEAIGGFIGGILEKTIEGLLNTIPAFGQALSDFMTNVQGFVNGARGIDMAVLEGIAILAGAILALTAAELMESIASWFMMGTSWVDIGDDLVKFAPKLKEFADEMSGINGESLKASAEAAYYLALFATNLPAHGGKLQEWLGETESLSDFANELKEFGPALKDYVESVDGITEDQIKPAMLAANLLAEFAGKLPRHGGILQEWIGDATLSTFAQELKDFAPEFVSFVEQMTPIANDNMVRVVETSIGAAEIIRTFAENLPKHGGVVQWWTGDASLSTFAEELKVFAPEIVSYIGTVKNIANASSKRAVQMSVTIAQMIADFESTLPESGGVLQWWYGSHDLTKFADELVSFGPAIADFADKVKNVNEDRVQNGVNAAKIISSFAAELQTLETNTAWENLFGGGSVTLESFGGQLVAFGGSLKTFYDGLDNLDVNRLSLVVNDISHLSTTAINLANANASGIFTDFGKALTDLADAGIDSLEEEFFNSDVRIESAISTVMGYVEEAIKGKRLTMTSAMAGLSKAMIQAFHDDAYWEMYNEGKGMIDMLSRGIAGQTYKAKAATSTMVDDIISVINIDLHRFKDSGMNIVLGIVNGINSYAYLGVQAGARLGSSTLDSLNSSLSIESPSKKSALSGMYFVQGFANNILKYMHLADDNAEIMGSNALEALNDAISRMVEYAMTDMDVTPTITPVLDLSNIQNGMNNLDAIWGSRSYNMGASISADRSRRLASRATRDVRTDDSALIKEIRELRDDMSRYATAVENTKVVLDGDTLVGAITPKIDRRLGKRAVYAGRRN